MYGIDRREFALTLAASLGILPPTLRQQKTAFIRRNVYCLTASSPEIRAYKRAIGVMRARPATDPTSWQAQSNMHGAFRPNPGAGIVNVCPPATPADFVAPPGMIADACQHNNLFFLAWHRMYLYYFERIVREASGDPNFALPYWAYSPDGPRNLPEPFRTPGDATNALWTDQRNSAINTGGNITASWVDASPALALTAFSSFQSSLESTPHGPVHGAVGGGCGWMSFFETAGMDPIFWLHHANIDRLWDDWIASGGGRTNPTTNSSWMSQSYTFYDEAGATVSLRVDQILETALQLNYRYAAPSVCPTRYVCICWPRRPWLVDVRLIALADSITRRPPLPAPFLAAQLQEPVVLGATPRELRLPIAAEAQERLSALARDPQAGGSIKLVLDEIRLQQNPVVGYEVYVNLPAAGRDTVYTSPHFIGNLHFFAAAHPDRRHLRREFDLVLPYVRLRSLKRWPAATLSVTLVPRPLVEGGSVARALGGRPQATIGRVAVVIE